MLPAHLVTNEVKNAAGVEIEFNRTRNSDTGVGFSVKVPNPQLPHKVDFDHQIVGEGTSQRRRSRQRVEYTVPGCTDATKKAVCVCNITLDVPIGNIENFDAAKMALANSIALLASTGADTVVKFDCTGVGADCLINGTL